MSVGPQNPYPTVGQVMNRARAYVNDAFRGGAGRILTNQASFSVEYLNGALEDMQERLMGSNGLITLIHDNVVLTPIPALSEPDPNVQVLVGYSGVQVQAAPGAVVPSANYATPALPQDCRAVLRVWERQTGSGLPFMPMTQSLDGLSSCYQGQWFQEWEYRQDAICLRGSTSGEDLRIRYEAFLQPIAENEVVNGANTWDTTEIAILASINVMAHIVAYFYARARGAEQAQVMQADAERYMRMIVRRYVRRAQRVPYIRPPYRTWNQNFSNGNNGVNLPF